MIAECLMLSQLKGYTTGGTIHFVINNQIGFTTAPQFSRSGPYCTDITKAVHRITSYNVCYTKLLRGSGNPSMGWCRGQAREV